MEINRQMLLQSFREETEDCLNQMEQLLLALETQPGDRELLSSLFRAAHTIKGNASLLQFNALAHSLHNLEDLLDVLRSQSLALSQELIQLLLQSVDALRKMAARVAVGDETTLPAHEKLFAKLAQLAADSKSAETETKPALSASAQTETTESTVGPKPSAQSLRVDLGKLDRMLNLTVEFAIAQGRLRRMLEERYAASAGGREILETHQGLESLFLELQELVMKVRMVPVGPTFHRLARSVRDAARQSGKLARMMVVGDDVEVDTTILEHIHDPLMHMIRNSVDHGLETPEVRRSLGKDPSGKIVLEAFHDSGNIVVRLGDDGSGLDHERIAQLARNRGIVPEGLRLTEAEIHNLIFLPGFSTSEKISELSGRGVGLDVVRRNVNALSGTIHVESRKGQGTTFTIRLPLTLAIIDGFAVRAGGETYVIPLSSVKECLELPKETHRSTEGGVLNLRGEALPYVRLRDLFVNNTNEPAREKIVVVEYQQGRAGIAVDDLLGEQQAVIKPLGQLFRGIPGVSGSTILGNGRVALILDVPALCGEAIRRSTEMILQ
ncbi:MAG TPA: chemotaxis protein CheA [Candidatus Angelobacter sp.]|nr:chemotaxis protein CheA [Candidatus Angelobacter sp.]